MDNFGNDHSFLHAKYGANRFDERRVMAEIRFDIFREILAKVAF